MTRYLIAAFGVLVCDAFVAGFGVQTTPASFSSKQLTVTNIDPRHFRVQLVDGTFSFHGLPTLHAVMPEKHMTLDGPQLDGTINPTTHSIQTAKLSGGVKGTLDSASKEGTERFTFSGSTLTYAKVGADPADADIDVTGGVNFGSNNAAANRTLALKGSRGTFHVRAAAGSAGLESADLDGPVTADFKGLVLEKDKDKAKKTPFSGTASGGHLTVRRSAVGYTIRVTGGVVMRELTGPLTGAVMRTEAVSIEIDAQGNLLSFGSEESTTATVPTTRHPK